MAKKLSEETQQALLDIISTFDQEDRFVRERQIRLWKKLEYMWSGFSRLWWSEVAHDWRGPGLFSPASDEGGESAYYDKPINVFRAFLESIIAAATSQVPAIKCIPDSADDSNDIATAKGGTAIAKLVYRHTGAPLLFMKAWWIYCIQGMIASYRYTKESETFGTYEKSEYKDEEVETEVKTCPQCGGQIDEGLIATELDEFEPEDHDAEVHSQLQEDTLCPQCLSRVIPELKKKQAIVTRFVGITKEPKSRQCVEILGGLNVKVPNYAHNQEEVPYLCYSFEKHYASVIADYPDMPDELRNVISTGAAAANSTYERWGRLNTQYYGEYPLKTPTVSLWWLRPCAFETVTDEKLRKTLKTNFPDGAKVVKINDTFCEAENSNLDDHWTLAKNPLSNYVHFDPHGLQLTPIQEITNDLIALVLQTIEHGIPQTFADPEVLNFDQYRQMEVAPGAIVPAKSKAGKSLQDSFHEVTTATLSREVQPFADKIQEMGQFTSGALPSLWGGNQEGSSRTAAQYAMSRAQSLQRLQIAWKMLTEFWKDTFGKVIPAFIKDMQEDERLVEDKGNGNFINTIIRKADLQGKIGSVELEASEQLPVSWAQKKDVLMSLLQSSNPAVIQVLSDPINAHFLSEALGVDEITIPGEDDRNKQYEEIQSMLKSGPIPGQQGETTSYPVELLLDNHAIEATVCKSWLISDTGRLAKIENEPGYKNVLLHLKEHIKAGQALKGPGQGPGQQQGQPTPAKPMAAPQGVTNG